MSFFEFRPKDVISTIYTAYPTRSLVLDEQAQAGDPVTFKTTIQVYDSGSGIPGRDFRTYYDINGVAISQSYHAAVTPRFTFSAALTGTEKRVINRLRETYFSSAFYKPENYGSSSVWGGLSDVCHILSIPNVLIGSGIKPGSLTFGEGDAHFGDDGYGGIYKSGGLIGCVFYEYGMALFGPGTDLSTFGGASTIVCKFSATVHTPMNVYICEAPRSMLNFSLNPSYSALSGTKSEITTEYPETFITTVGLYDEDYELVGVAKIANPILNQETDGVQFRLKLNF